MRATRDSTSGTRLAALDFGTNTALLLVAHETADGDLVEEYEALRTTRLGERTDRDRMLGEAGMTRSIQAAQEFLADLPRDSRETALIAAATSAVRDARNQAIFLERCAHVLGRPPLVLSGDEEAQTIFTGAASDQSPTTFLLTVDIGGGSTEISLGWRDRCGYSTSLDLGCIRLSERFRLSGCADTTDLRDAREYARNVLKKVRNATRDTTAGEPSPCAIVTGGTATTWAAYARQLNAYQRQAIHGYTGTRRNLEQSIPKLAGMTAPQRAALPGVSKGRAPVFPAGLVILAETLELFDCQTFTVSTRGLRFGLLRRLQRGELLPTVVWRKGGDPLIA
ncbi:MAG: hypothetical protein K9N51_07415 [Candidatus Pacebacteria bacterium]|nr:hypothetical protein [Candidatus Paceibacterota bacterium]